MDALARLETPRSAFAATFVPSSGDILLAGGCFHGLGFIVCWRDGETAWLHQEEPLLLTGTCVDARAAWLAVSAVGYRHGPGETQLYRLGDGAPTGVWSHVSDAHDGGVVFSGESLVTCRRNGFAYLDCPHAIDAPPLEELARASRRLAVLEHVTATGEGTALAIANRVDRTLVRLGTPHRADITAIAADPRAGVIYTGDAEGHVVCWRNDGGWAPAASFRASDEPIAAACVARTDGDTRLVLVAAQSSANTDASSSEVSVWRDGHALSRWRVPDMLGRTAALDESGTQLVVAGKAPGGGPAPGRAVLYAMPR